MTEYVRTHDKQKIPITVQRDGQNVQLMADERRINGDKLGFGVSERYPLHAATVASAGKYAYEQNIQILSLTGKALGQVFTGQRSVRNFCRLRRTPRAAQVVIASLTFITKC